MRFPADVRRAVLRVGELLDQKGYIAGTDGNVSVRLAPERILITPAGLAKGRLEDEDLVVVDLSGKVVLGGHEPSTESPMHLYVYQQRMDIGACVHSHAPYATSLAVAGTPLAANVLPELVLAVGSVPLTEEYAATGTHAVPESLAPYIQSANGFLLRNHGLLTIGRTVEEAYNRHETIEHYAKILHLALQLGGVNTLPQSEFDRLEAIRRNRS